MENLKGKKALITGGARGLGKATAIALAKEGVDIAITGRNEEVLKTTTSELESLGIQAIYSVFDVSNYKSTQAGLKQITDSWGEVDILINNAGIASFGTVNEMGVETWTQIINTNLLGMYYVTKEILPFMIKRIKEIFIMYLLRQV